MTVPGRDGSSGQLSISVAISSLVETMGSLNSVIVYISGKDWTECSWNVKKMFFWALNLEGWYSLLIVAFGLHSLKKEKNVGNLENKILVI